MPEILPEGLPNGKYMFKVVDANIEQSDPWSKLVMQFEVVIGPDAMFDFHGERISYIIDMPPNDRSSIEGFLVSWGLDADTTIDEEIVGDLIGKQFIAALAKRDKL
jgi:hypothetical protein